MLRRAGTLPPEPGKQANNRAGARLAAIFAALRKASSTKDE